MISFKSYDLYTMPVSASANQVLYHHMLMGMGYVTTSCPCMEMVMKAILHHTSVINS